jgi:hypothetical protein
MQLRGTYRAFPTGTAVAGATVGLYDADDLVTPLGTTTTGSDGSWTLTYNGSPGKFYVKITDAVNSITRWMSSRDTVFLGPNSSYDLNYVIASLGDGVCKGVLNEFATTGSALNSTVQTGAASIKGIVFDTATNTVLAHDAHDADPRKDRIVIRVTRLGEVDEGKGLLAIVKGTAAASPALPALTQSSSVWEYEIYEVDVPATSGAFTYTSRRTYINQTPIARTAPTISSASSSSPVSSFNTSGVLSSIYSTSYSSSVSVTDGFFEAYVALTVTSGTLTLAAYRDSISSVGQTVSSNTITGFMVLPVRVDFSAATPLSGSSRTFGIAAYTTPGAVITTHGYTGFIHQFRRS